MFRQAVGSTGRQADGQHSLFLQRLGWDAGSLRLLEQEEIGWKDILLHHFICTQQRMRRSACGVVHLGYDRTGL